MSRQTLLAAALLAGLSACLGTSNDTRSAADPASPDARPKTQTQTWTAIQPDLAISRPPFRQVTANWKQRLDQPYVYVDYTGSYVETGRLLPMVHQTMANQGLEPSGPPFALFYDDPGKVPADQLRSRACVPVATAVNPSGNLAYDVLPSTTVVYAFAGGPYPEVPRCYPGLYTYMQTMGWVENGPIRESYLIEPGSVQSYDNLLTEVQIPVTFAP